MLVYQRVTYSEYFTFMTARPSQTQPGPARPPGSVSSQPARGVRDPNDLAM